MLHKISQLFFNKKMPCLQSFPPFNKVFAIFERNSPLTKVMGFSPSPWDFPRPIWIPVPPLFLGREARQSSRMLSWNTLWSQPHKTETGSSLGIILWFLGGSRQSWRWRMGHLETLPGRLSTCFLTAEAVVVDDSQASSALLELSWCPQPLCVGAPSAWHLCACSSLPAATPSKVTF